MDLFFAPFLARIVLVEADEVAVVAFVQRLIAELGQAFLSHFRERQREGVLSANEGRGESDVERKPVRLQAAPGLLRLFERLWERDRHRASR